MSDGLGFGNKLVEDKKASVLVLVFTLFVAVVLLWVLNVLPKYAQASTVFLTMTAIIAGVGFSAIYSKAFPPIWFGAGSKPLEKLFLGLLIGSVLVLSSAVVVPIPQRATQVIPTSISDTTPFWVWFMNLLFIAVSAAPVEELFFRAWLMPSLFFALKTILPRFDEMILGLASILLQALVFAGFHLLVYAGNAAALQGTFLFAVVSALLLLSTKSVLTSIGLHYANNVLLFFR